RTQFPSPGPAPQHQGAGPQCVHPNRTGPRHSPSRHPPSSTAEPPGCVELHG
ncbi:hypothetical protein ABH925_007589, partial [Streptacidiphilus sp. EB129]